MKNSLTIKSARQTYQALMIENLAELSNELANNKKSLTIIDRHIRQFYPDFVAQLEKNTIVHEMVATEDTKTLSGVEEVLAFLQKNNATKSTTLIAIGGGIIQDIVSFSAHIYYRGISFIFVPTTLLAMSDSCIGAKCGLNYHGFKNQIGAFHAPEKVLICADFLPSLPDDAIYSGYGEIFKLMLIASEELYNELAHCLSREGFRNSKVSQFIYQSLTIKKEFIEEDEFDVGVRRILNYGHTFGHALELVTNYEIPHGIAVVHGIDIANYIAYRMGLLDQALYEKVHRFIKSHFNCEFNEKMDPDALIVNVQRDKKIADGKLNMIFLEKIGKLNIKPILLDQGLTDIIHDYFSEILIPSEG